MKNQAAYFLAILLISLGLVNNNALAQTSQCPYDYFESKNDRDYYSFKVSYNNNTRLACGTLSELLYYYKKYNPDNKQVEKWQVVDYINRGIIIKSSIPLDSLDIFYFSSKKDTDKADYIAQKGEKYFINYFFNKNGCVKSEYKTSEAALLKHLQNWCIVARQDDESGFLCIKFKYTWIDRQ